VIGLHAIHIHIVRLAFVVDQKKNM